VYIPHDRARERIIQYAAKGAERTATRAARYEIVRPGAAFDLSSTRFDVLGPPKIRNVSPGLLSENYNSLIVRATTAAGYHLLLTGDTSAGILAAIEDATPGALRAEVLKNPHHNGALPLSLLRKIAPAVVVVCNSSRPSSVYRKRIATAGADLLTACSKSRGGQGRVTVAIL
jgi:beta-lactamase superfamily II metal-dependent hydrolase